MADAKYQDRQNLEFFSWPELTEKFQGRVELVMVAPGNLSRQLRSELFTMASIARGCQHCQAHGAYTLHMMGVDPARIRDIWTFEDSSEFSEAERAEANLKAVGWSLGKHAGAAHEQRKKHPRSTDPDRIEY